MKKANRSWSRRQREKNLHALFGIVATALVVSTVPEARAATLFEEGDTKVYLDTTIKYSNAFRVREPSSYFTSNPNVDDGDRNFRHPGLISNRLDALLSFDARTGDYGIHAGAAGWLDTAYLTKNDNNSAATINSRSLSDHRDFTQTTKRLHGRNVELLDAFIHGKEVFDEQAVSWRVGRQTVLWGESLFNALNGIAAGQAPLDFIKALSLPGAEAKELFMPVGQALVSYQPRPGLALEGYYQFEWRKTRLPGVGSYFSTVDILDGGGEQILPGLPRTGDQKPKMATGQYGAAVKSRLGELDLGLYALRYNAKLPELYINGSTGTYNLVYPEGTWIYGTSASGSIGDANVAGEISVRRNMPLASAGSVFFTGLPADGRDHPLYPVGNSFHAQVSTVWVTPPLPLMPSGLTILGELSGHDVFEVTKNSGNLLAGRDRIAVGAQATVYPTYYGVLPGLDLDIPVGFQRNLLGKSMIDSTQNPGTGFFTIGVNADYEKTWKAGVKYTHYVGNKSSQSFKDRDFVALSLQRTF